MTVQFQFLGSGDAFGTGGRFNTCFNVRSDHHNFLIDCGASSLVAMRHAGVNPHDIHHVFITHLHGDHFAGLIFLLMDAKYVSARKHPLTISGPKGIEQRVIDTMNVLYPDCWDKEWHFEVIFHELELGRTDEIDAIKVTPFAAKHLQDGNDYILRFEADGKIITYSGDTGWTPELIPAAQGADLFVVESYFHTQTCEFHMDYETILENREALKAKQIILTHLGPDAYQARDQFVLPSAHDGLIVTL